MNFSKLWWGTKLELLVWVSGGWELNSNAGGPSLRTTVITGLLWSWDNRENAQLSCFGSIKPRWLVDSGPCHLKNRTSGKTDDTNIWTMNPLPQWFPPLGRPGVLGLQHSGGLRHWLCWQDFWELSKDGEHCSTQSPNPPCWMLGPNAEFQG